jgi:hypothetical protein
MQYYPPLRRQLKAADLKVDAKIPDRSLHIRNLPLAARCCASLTAPTPQAGCA